MMMKLALVLFVVCVAVEAALDGTIDAGIRGQGHLKHISSGLYVGYDTSANVLRYVASKSADTVWKFTSDNRWVHIADEKCVHPLGGSATPADQTRLTLGDCTPSNMAVINFAALTHGQSGNIVHMNSALCIHPWLAVAEVGKDLVIHCGCGYQDKFNYVFEDANGRTLGLE